MKPLKLTMSAFGPYAEKEEIDFSLLAGHRLFLIHGPTGGGKTIILDAICFALYGQSSGAERRERAIRSDHAEAYRATEVAFEFALGRERYKIWRSPRQERPKKRGEGMIPDPPKAVLHRMNDDWELLASGWKEVTARVEEMIGFRCEQFRQVVVLPQGEFRRLLSADSRERQEILAVLFDTRVYRQIEDALQRGARELKDEYTREKWNRDSLLDQAGADTLQALERSAAARKKDLLAVEEQCAAACLLERKAQSALKTGRDHDRALREARRARETVLTLRARSEVIDAREREADLARRVLGLADLESELRARETERDEKKAKMDEVAAALCAAEIEQKAGAHEWDAARAGQPERDAAKERARRLREFRQRAQSLERARREEASLTRTRSDLVEKQIEAVRAVDAARERLENSRKELMKLEEQSRRAGAIGAERDGLERDLDRIRRLRSIEAESRRASVDLARSQEKARRAESVLQRARAGRDTLIALREKGFAHRLALGLRAGEPCPVCGSKNHPIPRKASGTIPGDDRIRSMQQRVMRLSRLHEAARKEEQSLIALCSAKEGVRRALEDELDRHKDATLSVLEDRVRHLGEEFAKAAAAGEQNRLRNAESESREEEKKRSVRSLDEVNAALADLEKKLAVAATVVEERRALLGGELSEEKMDDQVAAAEEEVRKLEDTFRRAEIRFRESEKTLHGLSQRHEALREAYTEAAHAADRQARALEKRIAAAGFESRQAFDDARRDADEIERAEDDVRRFREEMAAAMRIAAERDEEAKGLEEPDIEGLESAFESARGAHLQVNREQSSLAERVERDTGQIAALGKIEKTMDRLDRRYKVIGTLADAACGRNERKLTLERYVLAALFEEATRNATRRLFAMSQKRYRLQRFEGHGDQRKAGGLELEVFDSWTGRVRPVATLSGGESFLAALSLALGLADVVQSFSGGIHLETIFVDEGFGTLDEESLNLAISALEDLQEKGRLVGIISHVPELKERIGARLEISRTGQGSRSAFVLNY